VQPEDPSEPVSPAVRLIAGIALSGGGLALLVVHWMWPHIPFDTPTLVLLGLVALPALAVFIKSAKLPGGIELALNQLRRDNRENRRFAEEVARAQVASEAVGDQRFRELLIVSGGTAAGTTAPKAVPSPGSLGGGGVAGGVPRQPGPWRGQGSGAGSGSAAGARGGKQGDGSPDDRSTWLTEDEDVWGADADRPPPVLDGHSDEAPPDSAGAPGDSGPETAPADRSDDRTSGLLDRLVQRYDRLRRTMPSGAERTTLQTRIVSDMTGAVGDGAEVDVGSALTDPSPGRRLSGYAALLVHPDPARLGQLVDNVVDTEARVPFNQYWAIRTLGIVLEAAGRRLDSDQVRRLRVLRSTLHEAQDRAYELDRVLRRLEQMG
jgi:hypothetical protein